jgi:26S proteasome regulatory subunit N10
VLCLDNSEFMRNGDYSFSRMESQEDAAMNVATSKLNDNPESTVAVVSMAGGVDVKLTLTTDEGNIITAIRNIKISGDSDFLHALQVSQLLLKNRQNLHGGQRIIAFVGSPVAATKEELVRFGKLLRKNGISLDLISIGEDAYNNPKLGEMIEAVNKKVDGEDNSHLVIVPSGPHVLSDFLLTTPIFSGIYGGSDGHGVNPNSSQMDPDLAAALEASIRDEEERVRKQTEPSAEAQPANPDTIPNEDAVDPDELLRIAIEMSMKEAMDAGVEINQDAPHNSEGEESNQMDEDDELRLAMEISRQLDNAGEAMDVNTNPTEEKTEGKDDVADIMNDPAFLRSVIGDLEGVDPNDPRILEMLQQPEKEKDKEEKK